MAITPANQAIFFSLAEVTLGEIYAETEKNIPVIYTQIATEKPSTTSQNVYAWTQMIPKARQWSGPRVVVEPSSLTYILVNRPWELTVGIDEFLSEDDHMGVFYRLLTDQLRQLRRHPDYWLRDLIEATGVFATGQPGSPQLGLDGLTYWNTAHPVDPYVPSPITYCNDFTGGGVAVAGGVPGGSGSNTTVGGTFGVTAFATLYEYMLRMLGEDGEPLGVVPNLLMAPVQLKTECELVLKNQMFSPPSWGAITGQVGAADNVFKRFGVDLLINPYLTSGTKWYMMDSHEGASKPFLWQLREASNVVPRISPDDPVRFDTHRLLWGGRGRGNAGWSFSFLCARSGT